MNKRNALTILLSLCLLLSGCTSTDAITFTRNENSETKVNAHMNSSEKDRVLQEDKELGELIEDSKEQLSNEDYTKIKDLHKKLMEADYEEDFENGDEIHKEISNILEDAGININDNEGEILGQYDVVGGKINFPKDVDSSHKKLWHKVLKTYANTHLSKITSFSITTDGKDGISGSIAPIDDKNKTFDLSLDPEDSFDSKGNLIGRELDHTLVHELFHIVTLSNDQMKDIIDNTGATLTIDEGTTEEKSYLNTFHEKFWKDIYEECLSIEKLKAESPEEAEDLSIKFYEKYSDQFVTDYAASNSVEDIAESFTYFVLDPKPQNNSIKNKKILFFYNYTELVKLRNTLRSNLELN
ncbi:MAG: hypothetical protein N4A57_15970 [Anaeromicrobium sp.]|jgi:hypothetical protein|uniref:hypothetical protein n=1 Tax=Anaeromicrobium sp. TaxID=1929132 RepID=UPI0025F5C768|nr:hypothetical protein [Anaeromicrobium sp.]MCT4595745.1 hypothetical protein [Anaeromicrobium sp.]